MRKGIEDYDRRHGWRGPITNKIKNKNWEEKIKVFKLDPTLNWQVAEIIDFNNQEINFKILTDKKNQRNVIKYKNFKWTLRKKTVSERHNIGDLIFVKKQNDNWLLKQYPKVNGGIIALDPYSGDVKALVGGFNFKSRNLIV